MGTLRLILAISVVLSHSDSINYHRLFGGKIAVELFFMISGFYMALVLSKKYTQELGTLNLFIINRIFKIFPLYLAILLSTLVFQVCTGSHYFNLPNEVPLYVKVIGFITNFTIVGQDLLLFIGYDGEQLVVPENFHQYGFNSLDYMLVIDPSWTLALELYFYVLIFLVFALGGRFKFSIILALLTASISLRFHLHEENILYKDPYMYRLFFSELYIFMYGVLGYYIYALIKRNGILESYSNSILIFALAALVYFSLNVQSIVDINLIDAGNMLKKEFFLLVMIFVIPVLFLVSKNSQTDLLMGELSYPIYLLHIPIKSVMHYLGSPSHGAGVMDLLWYTIVVSIVLNYSFQRPLDLYRQSLFEAKGKSYLPAKLPIVCVPK